MKQHQATKKREFLQGYGVDYLAVHEGWGYGIDDAAPQQAPPISNIIDALLLEPNSIVIEIGSGQGYFTLPIAKQLQQLKGKGLVCGLEFSKKMIEQLDQAATGLDLKDRIRLRPLINTQPRYALPLNDESADRVLIINSLQYLDDPLPVCREIARILKPGGSVLIADWSIQDEKILKGVGLLSLPLAGVLVSLSKASLGAYTRLMLHGYSWAVRATKLASLTHSLKGVLFSGLPTIRSTEHRHPYQ